VVAVPGAQRRRPGAPSAPAVVGAALAALAIVAGPAVLAGLVVPGPGDGDPTAAVEAAAGSSGAPAFATAIPTTTPPPPATAGPVAPPAPAVAPPAPPPPAAGEPDRVVIPAIDVDAPVVNHELDDDGELDVPGWDDAGWWRDGTRPGDPGPAVIVGHVDSRTGPAVFYRLEQLDPDDVVEVTLDGGGTARFAVQRTERFAKDEFPTLDVYGHTPGPELRLVTCGGEFDDDTGHYRDNLVVFATAL